MLNNNEKFLPEAGLTAFQKVLELTQAQVNSRELWLKLGA